MEKTIDKQTMLDLIVEAKRTDPETGGICRMAGRVSGGASVHPHPGERGPTLLPTGR